MYFLKGADKKIIIIIIVAKTRFPEKFSSAAIFVSDMLKERFMFGTLVRTEFHFFDSNAAVLVRANEVEIVVYGWVPT